MKIQRRKAGTLKTPVGTAIMNMLLNGPFKETTSVPVSVKAQMFVFDIIINLRKNDALRTTSQKQVQTILESTGKYMLMAESLDTKTINEIMASANVPRNNREAVTTIKDEIMKMTVRDTLLSLLSTKEYLNAKSVDDYLKGGSLKFSDLQETIRNTQTMYANLIGKVEPATVLDQASKVLVNSPVVAWGRATYEMLFRSGGAMVPQNKGFVLNSLWSILDPNWKDTGDTPMTSTGGLIEFETVLPQALYRIKKFNFFSRDEESRTDLSYSDCLGSFVIGLHTLMNIPVGTDTVDVPFDRLRRNELFGASLRTPMIPSEAGTVSKHSKELFLSVFMWKYLDSILTSETGVTTGKLTTQFQAQGYAKNPTYTRPIEQAIRYLGLIYDAFCDTAKMFYDLAVDESVYHPEVHPTKKKVLDEWLKKNFSLYSNPSAQYDNERHLYDGFNILGRAPRVQPVPFNDSDVNVILKDDEYPERMQFTERKTYNQWSMLKNDLISGFEADADVDADFNKLDFKVALPFRPDYVIEIDNPQDWKMFSGYAKLASLMPVYSIGLSGYARALEGRYTSDFYARHEEIAYKLGIPDEEAKKIYRTMKEGKWDAKGFTKNTGLSPMIGTYLAEFKTIERILLILPRDIFKLYEVGNEPENIDIPPFIGIFPYICEASREYTSTYSPVKSPIDSISVTKQTIRDRETRIEKESDITNTSIKEVATTKIGDENPVLKATKGMGVKEKLTPTKVDEHNPLTDAGAVDKLEEEEGKKDDKK